jgi:hypothetical protein
MTPKHSPALMIWGGISLRGTTPLKFSTGGIKSAEYIEILRENLLPTMEVLYPDSFVLQHDNAPAHTVKDTIKWFQENNLEVLRWPACSLDLNRIENVWKIMKDKV